MAYMRVQIGSTYAGTSSYVVINADHAEINGGPFVVAMCATKVQADSITSALNGVA